MSELLTFTFSSSSSSSSSPSATNYIFPFDWLGPEAIFLVVCDPSMNEL